MPKKIAASKLPAGDTQNSKSARTRQRILDAAAHVLSRKGFAGTRLTDVAEQAQVQAPAIYYYFPSREDLIEEVMWSGVTRLREHMEEVLDALPDGTDPVRRLDVAVAEHLRYELEISDYATASIRNAGQIPENLRIRYDAENAKYAELWRGIVLGLADEGLVRQEIDPSAARMLVIGALNWAAEWWNPRRGSLDVVVRTAQSLVRHGLCRPESLSESTPRPA